MVNFWFMVHKVHMKMSRNVEPTNYYQVLFQDATTVVESVVGYLVIFLVFLENILIMILLAKRSQIQVSNLCKSHQLKVEVPLLSDLPKTASQKNKYIEYMEFYEKFRKQLSIALLLARFESAISSIMGAWTLFKKVVEEKSGFYVNECLYSENVTDCGKELKNRLYCMGYIKGAC